MQRSFGIPPRTAREQAQKSYPASAQVRGAITLPAGSPGRAIASDVGIASSANLNAPRRLLVLGDSGGVADPNPQKMVCAAFSEGAPYDFAYHVGDLDYYNGDPAQWVPQFYEPYCHSLSGIPILAIPGNHDGDNSDGVTGSGIRSFMANFCTKIPTIPPGDPQFEYERHTQTQPYCDWTLNLDLVTIIGVWSNVPSGGVLFPSQTQWLTSELKAAPADLPVIVALHHPPYSVDAFHGGSATMGSALDTCFQQSGRYPQLVLSGHVHDYQRFTRDVGDGTEVTYIVQGNSGYHNLHSFATDAKPGLQVADDVVFENGFDDAWGYLTLTIEVGGQINGFAYSVTSTATKVADLFTINF